MLKVRSRPCLSIRKDVYKRQSLGYTMQVAEQESVLMSKDEILEKIRTLTGGRAAEEFMFNICTSGASNDIEHHQTQCHKKPQLIQWIC